MQVGVREWRKGANEEWEDDQGDTSRMTMRVDDTCRGTD